MSPVSTSMGLVQTQAAFPAASMTALGMPTASGTFEGDESAVRVSVQIDIYTKGQTALSDGYKLDQISHRAMCSMGFKRTYGAEPMMNADNSIKRLVSRYAAVLANTNQFNQEDNNNET